MQNALNDIAGTGSDRHRHYLAQVDAYHRQWRDYFVSKIFAKTQITDFDSIPRFAYHEENASLIRARVGVAIAALLTPAAVVTLFGLLRLRRFAVV
jgi:ABC-2 type transport system permease protein